MRHARVLFRLQAALAYAALALNRWRQPSDPGNLLLQCRRRAVRQAMQVQIAFSQRLVRHIDHRCGRGFLRGLEPLDGLAQKVVGV